MGRREACSWLNALSLERVAEAKGKALAEHVARHPEDVGRTVDDFNWILRTIVRPAAYWNADYEGLAANDQP
jgi:hypothetical protein